MEQDIELHAFGTYAPPTAEILIIGTFPTHKRNREFEFFYPNKQNVLWKLLETIYNHRFHYNTGEEALNERKEFASQQKIAFTDMLAKAIRSTGKSSDNQLIPIEIMDILSILKVHPSIQRIILTSRSGKNSALSLFKCHLANNNIPFFESEQLNLIVGHFQYLNKDYEVKVLYSPSPRVERQFGFNVLQEMYTKALVLDSKNDKI